MAKGEAASPTIGLESVLLTATIEAHENRDVAVIDIPKCVRTDGFRRRNGRNEGSRTTG